MSMLSISISTLIALVFLRAFLHKIMAFQSFTGYVEDYRLMPLRLVQAVSVSIVVAELLVVISQSLAAGRIFGLLLAAVLLFFYSCGISVNIKRGRSRIECGCGGGAQALSWSLVMRNSILIGLIAIAITQQNLSLSILGNTVGVVGGISLWTLFLLGDQIIANSSMMVRVN
ncbi:MauE/DoxX family redox-associated membrane protein [Acidomonas methanolica]|uniref:MauE/DoxX family redox-associated membrane protein n=1 Tax=Acidomonas methanolica TaxID=437 RepID=UPI0005AB8E05|nr:MauE/DoxX family redox-associated membrane protein [Acidomonas methanolica]MBU2654754.1 hypothetical protein [Acidomonas methanolica]TCS26391.1 methylamine utilization protein MauE [Acidomonas methanolica]